MRPTLPGSMVSQGQRRAPVIDQLSDAGRGQPHCEDSRFTNGASHPFPLCLREGSIWVSELTLPSTGECDNRSLYRSFGVLPVLIFKAGAGFHLDGGPVSQGRAGAGRRAPLSFCSPEESRLGGSTLIGD